MSLHKETHFDLVTPGEGGAGWACEMVPGLNTRFSQETEDKWQVPLPWLLRVA